MRKKIELKVISGATVVIRQSSSYTDSPVPRLRGTLVLIHGLGGFDALRVGGWTVCSYFPRIPELLRRAGNRVLVPCLSPTRSVAERAAELHAFLKQEAPAEPLHLLAHSMGGLDARYLISRLGLAGQVLTLTTLGTPHRGTCFADWAIRRLERLCKPLCHWLGIPVQGFYDLTVAGARRLNELLPDAPGVRYFSVAGLYPGGLVPEWLLSHRVVLDTEGPNDGIVSVASARYGEDLGTWPGDHLRLVNWVRFPPIPPQPDATALYIRLVQRLAQVERELGLTPETPLS
jgi:triacylglycerol lipase